jgi:hypothetical protein
MALKLDYSLSKPRRRWFVITIAILAISASYVLAVPKFKAFRERQIRRAAIRQQFDSQLAVAESALRETDVFAAARALVRAEFSTRAEAKLFWSWERKSFARWAAPIHGRIAERYALLTAQWELERKEKQRRDAAKAFEKIGILAERVSFTDCRISPRDLASGLVERAAQKLKSGDLAEAERFCELCVKIYPVQSFDAAFWANAGR